MTAAVDGARILTALLIFASAAWFDWRTRRVPNRLWPAPFVVGLGAIIADGAAGGPALAEVASAMGVTALAFLVWVFFREKGGGIGAADAKGIMVLGWLFPVWPVSGLLFPPLALVAYLFGSIPLVAYALLVIVRIRRRFARSQRSNWVRRLAVQQVPVMPFLFLGLIAALAVAVL